MWPAKTVLQRAADVRHQSLSEFVVDSSLTDAAETLVDCQHLVLSDEQWKAFHAALDVPTTKAKPRLGRLLRKPSVLE